MLRKCLLLSLFLALNFPAINLVAFAQPPRNEEQILQHIIKSKHYEDADDIWFMTNAYPHPIVGKDQLYSRIDNLPRTNVERQDHPERIVVSPSGDMAYDYGHADQRWTDTGTGKKHHVRAAYLRVWKKVNGEWQVAAETARPDEPQRLPQVQ